MGQLKLFKVYGIDSKATSLMSHCLLNVSFKYIQQLNLVFSIEYLKMNWNVETLMKKSPQPANACRNLEIKHLINMKDVEQNE